jgi:hypothetical protein
VPVERGLGTTDVRDLVDLFELNLERWPLGRDGGCSWHVTRCHFASIPASRSILDVCESEQGSSLERGTTIDSTPTSEAGDV